MMNGQEKNTTATRANIPKQGLLESRRCKTTGSTFKVVIIERPFSCGYKFFLQSISLLHQLLELLFLLFNLFFCHFFHNL